MSKVDVSNWGSFLIEEIFQKQEGLKPKNGFQKNFDVATEQDQEYKIPIVNAKHGNNGIMYYGKSEFFDTVKNSIDIVQNGAASVGDVYYQPQATGVLGDAYLVKVKGRNCSPEQMLFLTSVLYKVIKGRFSYDDKATWDRVKKVRMPLPITPDGEPDWAYMEAYIKGIREDAEQAINLFGRIAKTPPCERIDISGWKEFGIDSLFSFMKIPGDNQAKKLKEGKWPLVSAGSTSNGICAYIAEGAKDTQLYSGNMITVDMFGQAFYQPNPFYCVSHARVNILNPKFEFTPHIGLFLASLMTASFFPKYGYDTMCSQTAMKQEKVVLPTDKEGNPDWNYMDAYIEQMMNETGDAIERLLTLD